MADIIKMLLQSKIDVEKSIDEIKKWGYSEMLNYILEVGKHCIGYTFGFFVMRFIFDSNIRNPWHVFIKFLQK